MPARESLINTDIWVEYRRDQTRLEECGEDSVRRRDAVETVGCVLAAQRSWVELYGVARQARHLHHDARGRHYSKPCNIEGSRPKVFASAARASIVSGPSAP